MDIQMPKFVILRGGGRGVNHYEILINKEPQP